MALYNYSGNAINVCYSKNGTEKSTGYDINGNPQSSIDDYLTGRTLVWEDNFETFNSNNWGYEIGYGRNQATELECYRAENVSIEDGVCVLTAKRENYGSKSWTSGSITTMGKKYHTYGRMEAKMKFESISGSFPAFWMLGENMTFHYTDGEKWTVTGEIWPKCGECDIVEIYGTANTALATLYKYSGTPFNSVNSHIIDTTDWHVYAVEWTQEYMAMLVDGIEYQRFHIGEYSYNDAQAYFLPMNLKLNLAVGGQGGTPSAETNEMKMYIDWVRVYAPIDT